MYLCTSLEEQTGLHAQFQVHRCFDVDLVCIVMYCQDTKEGLTNKLQNVYTYALENGFTCKISGS